MSSEHPGAGLFRRDGDYWTLGYAGRIVLLKDIKGLHYVSHLLRHPGRDFSVAELRGLTPGQARGGAGGRRGLPMDVALEEERARKAVTNRIRQSIARIAALHAVLGIHLANAVHTGARCVYTSERTVRWSE